MEITIQKESDGTWTVRANGGLCWQGAYSSVSVLGSKLAKDLNWTYRMMPPVKPVVFDTSYVSGNVKVFSDERQIIWKD